MSARNIFTSFALLALLGTVAPPALTAAPAGDEQGRAKDKHSAKYSGARDQGRSGGDARGGWRSRAPDMSRAPAPRESGDRAAVASRNDGGQRSGGPVAVPRGQTPRANDGARDYRATRDYDQSRDYRGSPSTGRGYDDRGRDRSYGSYGRPGYSGYGGSPGYDYRRGNPPRAYGGRAYYSAGRYRPYYGPTYRAWYRPQYYYSRPYYAFRPRFSIGFGISIGYPVAFPTYGYAPYPVYGYPSGGYVSVGPARAVYGAISFEITPFDADVYVDGSLIGRVGDFTPNQPPLTLTAGPHQIEVYADGYQPLSFTADVVPGQVVPYRGQMRPW